MATTKVAVAGPNGTLGPPVIEHLVKHGFDVTLLSRNPDKAAQRYPPPTKLSEPSTFREGPFDSFVILINRDVLDSQIKLINAAIAPGVSHVVPSCFGIDTSVAEVRQVPQIKGKIEMEGYVLSKASESHLSYTGVNTGLFFDWLPVNLKDGPTFYADDRSVALSVSTLDLIGQAVAKGILKRDEARNRFLFVHSAVVTQNQLLQYAREIAPGRDFKVVEIDTAKAVEEAREKMRSGVTGPAVAMPFMTRVSFGLGLGLFKETDNAFLGLETMSEGEVKDLVASYMR